MRELRARFRWCRKVQSVDHEEWAPLRALKNGISFIFFRRILGFPRLVNETYPLIIAPYRRSAAVAPAFDRCPNCRRITDGALVLSDSN